MQYNVNGEHTMRIGTTVYQLNTYKNLTELARAMGLSVSQVYRVKKGERPIGEKFILGAIKAFPDKSLSELFYLES